ncbi:MAG: DUF4855 domain-containing protein [Bacteroidaceae bacterium]|nr:DUF4855 domain-containing protein [Bacteroidaceae bacterium]
MNKIILTILLLMGLAAPLSAQDASTAANSLPTSPSGYAPKGSISDMVLIYHGGTHRKETWDPELFKPYVYAERDGGKGDWLWDGFLFLEIFDGQRCGFASGYRPTPATKADWLMLLDKLFTPGHAIYGLDLCIQQAQKVCGKLPKKRQIVIALPEPIPNQKNWGEIDGRALDFSVTADRIAACKWYIDRIVERFKQAKLKNVELAGYYWLAEEATNTRDFVSTIADYIHLGKKQFYWIPYFMSDGYSTWRELGFDKAYLQPNHFFNDKIPDSRIDEACRLGQKYHMSMEFEFDRNALDKSASRMEAYIDGFERNGVFRETDLAYYQGGDGVWALFHGNADNRALYYRLANLIAERQKTAKKRK